MMTNTIKKIDAIKLKKYIVRDQFITDKIRYITITYVYNKYEILMGYDNEFYYQILYHSHIKAPNLIKKLLFSNDLVKIQLGLNLLQ
jgi:hypothetical protein